MSVGVTSGDGPAFGAITTPQSSWPSNELVGKRRKLLGEVASPQVANAPKESQMVESDNALGEAQGDRLVVDIGGVGRAGEGQTDPGNHVTAKFRSHRGPFPTTSPFGPRTAEPVGSVNVSPDRSQRDD